MQIIADKEHGTRYLIAIAGDETGAARANLLQINDAIFAVSGRTAKVVSPEQLKDSDKYVILCGNTGRESSKKAYEELKNDEYIIRYCPADEGGELVIAYKGGAARICAIDRLIDEIVLDGVSDGASGGVFDGVSDGVSGGVIAVPEDLNVKGSCSEYDAIRLTSIPCLRDPFILKSGDGIYYAYGTGWRYYKTTDPAGSWDGPFDCVVKPYDAAGDHWAPEVHKYRGSYYMITTYRSASTGHRGCAIFRSNSPEGPFIEITGGHITPAEWDSIDGTLYIDEAGKPWMVFVHEWTSTPDRIGRMAAAPMSEDLTRFTEEPVELFTARDPAWARNGVTDGCFMYKATDGKLWMLWSNWGDAGYCVGMACSENGSVTGPWKQDDRLLYSKGLGLSYDGGHGMLFEDNGRLWLSLHSPNSSRAGRPETPVLIPVAERFGRLVLDFWQG